MITIAEFDTEPDTQLVRKLLLLILMSTFVHGLGLSWLRMPAKKLDAGIVVPIELSMVKHAVTEYATKTEEQRNDFIAPSSRQMPVRQEAKDIVPTSATAQARENKIVTYAPRSAYRATPACNPQQKRTAGHVCAQPSDTASYQFSGAYQANLDKLFREERSVTAERASDLKAIDALLAQQLVINKALSNFEKPPAHLLKEKQWISGELSRIDKKYASVNLLKVLGSAYGTTKKMLSSSRQKKQGATQK